MCGIYGFNHLDENRMKSMLRASAYRGPDGNGIYSDKSITLGHNLLAITEDPLSSKQPWVLDDRWVLCFNGEIYNYLELKSTLEKSGETFTTESDTEILAKGLRRYGKDFIHKLDGMYAIAWYDKLEQTLIFARDAAGAKPLFVYRENDILVFSSSIKSIAAYGVSLQLPENYVQERVQRGSRSGTTTSYRNITKLYPGQIIKYRLHNLSKELDEHVHKKHELIDIKLEDAEFYPYLHNNCRHTISESVISCLMGRRPIGLYLSGGLDSSIVLHELVQHQNKPKTFTTRFSMGDGKESGANSDADVALKLSEHYGTDHTELLVTEQDYIKHFEDTVWALEEPFSNKSTPAYYALNKTVSENGVVVTLSGDGGDELFTGYKRHLGIYRKSPEEKEELQKEFITKWSDFKGGWFPVDCLSNDHLNTIMYKEFLCRVAENFLIRNDNLGMNFSMEARFPLTTDKIKKFAYSIPSQYKIRDNSTKVILRESYRGIIPDFVLDKHKTGWSIPKNFLFNPEFKSWALEQLPQDRAKEFLSVSSYREMQSFIAPIAFSIWARLFKVAI